jgi:tricorn protease
MLPKKHIKVAPSIFISARRLLSILGLCCTLVFSAPSFANANDQGTALLRYADIHYSKVTFVYGGDIYVGDIDSGKSTRLTAHIGTEMFPKFSRDGNQIAFTAEYSGNRQVYIMNLDGSGVKQLTYYNDVGAMPPRGGYDYRILDWSPDNTKVLVRANRLPWGKRMGQPYWIPVDGSLAEPLPVPETGGGMLSPDGTQYVYTPIDREFRTWKRYRGGRAQDVWVYDLTNNTSKQLTTHRATDYQPVWVGEDIFFLSDRDYYINLYQYQNGSEPKQITKHQPYDSLWASAGPKSIVYENGGHLWRYIPTTAQSEQIKIRVEGNPEHLLPSFKDASKNIESMSISHNGKRAIFSGRGEIFSVPAKNGITRNLSNTPKSREISVSWSPDGKSVAYLSDKSGEYEVYMRRGAGLGKEERLTSDGKTWRFKPVWSPDSKKLAFFDKDQILWSLDVKSKKLTQLDQAERNDIQDYTWSPDSQWLAYTKLEDNGFGSIWVVNVKKAKPKQLSSSMTHEAEPQFTPNGHYIVFLSNRDYNLAFSSYEFNYLYVDATRVYAAQLNAKSPALYPFQSDEVLAVKPKDIADAKSISIDFDGFAERTIALTNESANYSNLQTNDSHVFVNLSANGSQALKAISLSKADSSVTVDDGIGSFVLSHDGTKLLAQKGGKYSIIDAKPGQKFADGILDLSNMQVKVDPKTEWQQIYVDGWRVFRDWFYDPNIHGMDWNAIKDKYQPWIDAAAHRSDVDYAFGEIGGELNAGHIYVNYGDQPSATRRDTGLFGAQISEHRSGYFKIEKIFKGENWHKDFRSPLTEPKVKAKDGDYIVAINGVMTNSVNNIYELMENTSNKPIELTLNSKPKQKGSWTTIVTPIASETNLRYLNWVLERAAMVDKLSNGRIGYAHLPNTAIEGNRELFKRFVPQIGKDAMIIDDRYNGGGFIPDRMIEMLSRTTMNYWKFRGHKPQATPLIAHDGPKVMLINGYSSSGGDALPFYFRQKGLGKIIGTRTWGGLIGISGNPQLVDGAQLFAATFRIMDPAGNWVVENEGVEPDIKVIDRPELIAKGRDPSLERGVEELLKQLKQNPRKTVKVPPAPTEFN